MEGHYKKEIGKKTRPGACFFCLLFDSEDGGLSSSEMSANMYQTTRHHITEYSAQSPPRDLQIRHYRSVYHLDRQQVFISGDFGRTTTRLDCELFNDTGSAVGAYQLSTGITNSCERWQGRT
jgi:hypothetical protein